MSNDDEERYLKYRSNRASWMYKKTHDPEFREGVRSFLWFAFEKGGNSVYMGKIMCPCRRCKGFVSRTATEVYTHILKEGFTYEYLVWFKHGEKLDQGEPSSAFENVDVEPNHHSTETVLNAASAHFGKGIVGDSSHEEEKNVEDKAFYELLEKSNESLYSGCKTHTTLSTVTSLLRFKTDHNISERGFNDLLTLIKEFLPSPNQVPESYYTMNKMVEVLGPGHEKARVCKDGNSGLPDAQDSFAISHKRKRDQGERICAKAEKTDRTIQPIIKAQSQVAQTGGDPGRQCHVPSLEEMIKRAEAAVMLHGARVRRDRNSIPENGTKFKASDPTRDGRKRGIAPIPLVYPSPGGECSSGTSVSSSRAPPKGSNASLVYPSLHQLIMDALKETMTATWTRMFSEILRDQQPRDDGKKKDDDA